MEEIVVEARGVRKRYPGGTEALRCVELEVARGSRFVLLGPNGAGKSTLVRIISTLSRAEAGEVRICSLDPRQELRKVMELIGLAGQENDLDPEGRCAELLEFQGALFGMGKALRRERAEELIELFTLGEHRDKRVKELSGGNKRKLHCALAVVHRPKILFLDEPTVGMDPEVRSRFWESLRRMGRDEGMTLFLTTQYLEEADRHADEMALIAGGRIRYRGTVSAFKELAFGGSTGEVELSGRVERDRNNGSGEGSLEDGYLRYLSGESGESGAEELSTGISIKRAQEVQHVVD